MKCEFFIKQFVSKLNKTTFRRYIAVPFLLLCFIFPETVRAQMFSVGNESGLGSRAAMGVYLGPEPASFNFRRSAMEGGEYEFSGPLVRFRLETPGINLFIASGGRATGLDDVTYFDAGVKAGYGLNLFRGEHLRIDIPLQLTTSVTSVVNRNRADLISNTQFQQGALLGGAGGFIAVRTSPRVRFHINAVPSYGFSFATGNTFGGSLGKLEGQARMFLDQVFGNVGLSIGYDYLFKRYNIDEDSFDYDFKSHSILIGLTF